ncbi:TIGR03545 family protein [Algibacillus agarilyticus]|uniref:TIGR03545 family protein n=1 Tax=Algibacillus agarilyticus TaxID=2234133 RepID=UPI000DD0CC15|nr:TIGR03545 family protein [Algibacillus agarilyticus]
MKKYLRWQGLSGLLVTLILIASFVYFFAGQLMKIAIEEGLGYYLGAEVNVEEVDVSWSPFGVKISQFQATDKADPEFNLLSFKQANATVDALQYLFGKTIIDELTLDTLAFNTPRTSAGEVYQPLNGDEQIQNKADEQAQASDSVLPSTDFELPSVDNALKDEALKTPKLVEQLKAQYAQDKIKIKALKDQLPNDDALKQYEKDVKALMELDIKSLEDIQQAKDQLSQLKKQFKQDKQAVSALKDQLRDSQETISKLLKDLKNAPEDDWQYIETKYQLDDLDAGDVAHLLFGDKARSYVEKATLVYNKIKPLLAKDASTEDVIIDTENGRYVHFKDDNPLPKWLVKTAKLSISTQIGELTVNSQEITSQHWIRNKPTTWQLDSSQKQAKEQIKAKGQLTINQAGDLNTHGDWMISEFTLGDLPLQDSDSLQLTLANSALSGQGDFKFENTIVASQANIDLVQPEFTGNTSSSFSKALLKTLNDIDTLDIKVSATGEVTNPDLSIRSSLDSILKEAVKEQAKAKLDTFKVKIKDKLKGQVSKGLNLDESEGAELNELSQMLEQKDNKLNSLLNSSIADKQKKKLEDKLESKLKKGLGKLFG